MEEEYYRFGSDRSPRSDRPPRKQKGEPLPPVSFRPDHDAADEIPRSKKPSRRAIPPQDGAPKNPPPQPLPREAEEPEEAPAGKKPKRRSLPARLLFFLLKVSVAACVLFTIVSVALPSLIPEPSVSLPGALGGATSADLLAGIHAPGLQNSQATSHQRRSQVYNFVLLGRDVSSGNTDSIIVVSYDVPQKKMGMISIPRDTAVKRSWRSNPKINGAFFGSGPDTLKEEIYNTFGIPIDFYVLVDLEGFIALVDELQGVDVEIPVDMNYDDPTVGQELHIHFQKGPAHLDGQSAMEAVRYRHDNDNPDGSPGPNQDYTDVGRAAFQRQVLTQLARKVISWNSIPRIASFIEIFRTYVQTDLSASDMLWFASQAMKLDPDTAVTQGVLEGRGDAVCKGVKWCYVFQAEDILPVLNEQVNPFTEDLTEDDLHLIRADRYLS